MKVEMIPLSKIKLSTNSRMSISKEDLSDLMQSIKQNGILQPIGVKSNGKAGQYEINYGNRRFLAASKLGHAEIPCVIQDNHTKGKSEIQNLTENIQRKNISLAEIGRYIELLGKDGLAHREISTRLGVTLNFVRDCVNAYRKVPTKFRDDLEPRMQGKKPTPGKISMTSAQAIISAQKTHFLDQKQTESLFAAAKSKTEFNPENVGRYAKAIKAGNKDFLKAGKPLKQINLHFFLDEAEYDKLHNTHVENGHYRSITALCLDILKGKRSVKINILTDKDKK